MDVKAGPLDMEDFVKTVVEAEVNPTLLLLEWKPGFVIGGFAGVPWPKNESRLAVSRDFAADPGMRSFIFSFEPEVRRFNLVEPDRALAQWTCSDWRSFGFGNDLSVCDDGICNSFSDVYAGGRDDGNFPDNSSRVHFTRFELWAL
jgi:hypothetical protein